jgi:hypothetical protein
MRTLLSPPPGTQVSGPRSAAVCRAAASRTVLASKGSLRRAQNRRALAFCAPLCRLIPRDGRLRREPDTEQFLRLTKDEDQVGVDKTS